MRFLILIPILMALLFLEVFIGGARLLYSIPGMAFVALAAILSGLPGVITSQRANILALATSCLFAAYVLIRNRLSEVEYIARMQFFIMAGCLMIYLIFSLVLSRPLDRKRLFFSLGILALLQMVPAMMQFTQENQWMPLSWAQRLDESWRASGFFISPNHFAGFLEVIALFAMSYTLWGRTTVMVRILTGYTALLCIAGVAISGSRGGYLSLILGTGMFVILTLIAWHRMKRDHFLLVALLSSTLALALFAGILWIIFQSPHLSERIMQINDPENMRLLLWRSALEQFHLSPIWGTGGFSFLYFGRLFRDPRVQNDPIHVHDDYLQLLADYGVVGITLFVFFLIAHLRTGGISFFKLSASASLHISERQSDRLALNIGALAAVGAYLLHSVVDFNMQLPLNAFMMAVVFSILANPGSRSESPRSNFPEDTFRRLLRYALPLLAIVAISYGIPMVRGEYLAERARVALRDGRIQEGLDWARQGTLKTRDNPELYYYQGEAALELSLQNEGNHLINPKELPLEAVASFASGLKVFPYDSRLALKLAQAQTAAGDYFSAIKSVATAEKMDPNSAFVPAYRGIVEYSFGYFDEARIDFDQATELGGEGAEIARTGLNLLNKKPTHDNLMPSAEPYKN